MTDIHRRRVVLELPWRTILKVLAAIALVWTALQLTQILLVILVALILAVALDPIVGWLERRKVPRWAGAGILAALILVIVGGFLWMTWASLVDQGRLVAGHLGDLAQRALHRLPPWLGEAIGANGTDAMSGLGARALNVAQSATSAAAYLFLGFVLTIYLLIEGRRTYEWVLAFAPRAHRPRINQTLEECREVVFGYVAGNVITSIIATACTLVVLWVLGVPAALFLALIAGLSDFVPVMGFIVSAIPAIALALTVSTKTALLVVVAYIVYNTIEAYLLSPWAYGNRLRLSSLAVILAFVVGAELAGVIGAVIALPIAAIYPIIERNWLREQLAEETVAEHRTLDQKAG